MKLHIDCYGRECKQCREYKKFEDYYKEPATKVGFRSICKVCDIKRSKKYSKPRKGRKFNDIKLEGFNHAIQDFCLGIKKAG